MNRSLMALAIAAALVACDDSTTEPAKTYRWQGELSGDGDYAQVTGEITVESSQKFEAEIEISGAEPESEYAWHVAKGTCEEPGDVLGAASAYPKLETDEEGAGSAKAVVSAKLDTDGEYHAEVYFVEEGEGEEDDVIVVVACGDLSLEDQG